MSNLNVLPDRSRERLAARPVSEPTRELHVHDHAVQFYDDDAFLAAAVSEFLWTGLQNRERAIVVATPAHRRAFAARLRRRGADVRTLRQDGHLVFLDAKQLLARFMVGDVPDPARFQAAVGRVIERHRSVDDMHQPIRAYGEMVDLLWKEGNTAGAIAVEELWNELAGTYDFSLLCAYSMGNFYHSTDCAQFEQICRRHTRVTPAESTHVTDDPARLMELTVLQQRSRALETEIIQRELLEQRLRETVIALQEREDELRDGLERERNWRIQAERARQDADRARATAEQANRAKSDFLAMMSHELRTPLNAIGGYAELMELGIHGAVSEEQRDALDRIQRSQRVLLGLINQVLNYARIESGNVRYELVAVPLDELVRSTEPLVSPQLRQKGVRFVYDGCAPDVCVHADGEKLRQILLNLLSNALKFTDRGGMITVDVGVQADEVHLRVADTGIGIGNEKLASIFDPFVQVDSNYTRTRDGVGLGLAISRDLARGMGGDIAVASTTGRGTTFTVRVPRHVETA